MAKLRQIADLIDLKHACQTAAQHVPKQATSCWNRMYRVMGTDCLLVQE